MEIHSIFTIRDKIKKDSTESFFITIIVKDFIYKKSNDTNQLLIAVAIFYAGVFVNILVQISPLSISLRVRFQVVFIITEKL